MGNRSALVGLSERTSPQGVERLALQLFEAGEAERVVAVEMPKARAQMHLDTVMTMADEGTFVKYAGLGMLRSYTIRPGDAKRPLHVEANAPERMHAVIAEALGLDSVRVLTTPQDSLAAEREQWNDGANLLAVAPVPWSFTKGTPSPTSIFPSKALRFCRFRGMNWGAGGEALVA